MLVVITDTDESLGYFIENILSLRADHRSYVHT